MEFSMMFRAATAIRRRQWISLVGALLLVACAVANAETVGYAYDDANRLTKVTAPDGKTAKYTYDGGGRLVVTERDLNPKDGQPQVLVTYQRYDTADRVVSIAHLRRNGDWNFLVAGQAITRGPRGAIQNIDTFRSGIYDLTTGEFTGIPAVAQAFEYDGNARLTRERRTKNGFSIDTRYDYDTAGNRKTKIVATPAGTETTQYNYDVADRLKEERTTLASGNEWIVYYAWDGNGNLAGRSEPGRVTLYNFDPQNRLISVRVGGSVAQAQAAAPSVSYAYDAQGNRVRKRATDDRAYLIDPSYSFPQLAVETWSTGRSYYVRGLDVVRQTIEGGPLLIHLFPLHGHLGTSLGAVDARGEVVEQVDVDAFGILDQPSEELKQGHVYTGEYWDQDAQLLYLRARWYDPRLGRFISADPFEGRQKDPRSLNRYAYAHNDPLQHVDPTGRMSVLGLGATALGLGTIATLAYHAPNPLKAGSYTPTVGSSPPFSLTAALLGPVLRGAMRKAAAEAKEKAETIDEPDDSGDRHHTIPIYLCGAEAQMPFMPLLPGKLHRKLHRELVAYSILTEGAMEFGFAILPLQLKLNWYGNNRLLIHQMAAYPSGRAVIAEGLREFYEEKGYSGEGLPPGVTVGGGLAGITPPYLEGTATSLILGCRRPRTLR